MAHYDCTCCGEPLGISHAVCPECQSGRCARSETSQEAVMQSDIVQRLRRTGELGIFEAIDQGVYSSWEDAADEIERNRAEITRLTEALRAAEEREKALREALEPFAKCCEDWISDDEDDKEWAKFRLLIKDYRRASVAMKEQGHDG